MGQDFLDRQYVRREKKRLNGGGGGMIEMNNIYPCAHFQFLRWKISTTTVFSVKMSFFFGNRSSKTFKPKKNIPEGSHQHELMKHAAATLGSGSILFSHSFFREYLDFNHNHIGDKLSHAKQKFVKSSCVLTILTLC